MYIQPIITSAFATYAMSRSLYTDQAFGAQGPSRSAMNQRADGVSQGSGVGVTSGNEKVSGVDKSSKSESIFDPDAGKPKSASGDVLDLSQEARAVSTEAGLEEATESKQATGTEQAKESAKTTGTAATRSDAVDLSESGQKIDQAQAKQAEVRADVEQALDKQDLNRQEVRQTEEQVAQTRTDRKKEDTSSDEIKLERSSQGVPAAPASASMESTSELTPEEEEQVRALRARDAEVRQHEQQHLSAGGAYVTGGPTYTYQTGPDGKRYAIGGEVSIDVSEVSGDPQATISKMQTVQAAALAPAEPSSQDQKVAAAAQQTQAKARMELSQLQSEQMKASMESVEEEATVATPDTAKAASDPAEQNASKADASSTNASSVNTSKADAKAEDKQSSSKTIADASKASDSTNDSSATAARSSTGSAYAAQSKMVSGQTGGARFSTFA